MKVISHNKHSELPTALHQSSLGAKVCKVTHFVRFKVKCYGEKKLVFYVSLPQGLDLLIFTSKINRIAFCPGVAELLYTAVYVSGTKLRGEARSLVCGVEFLFFPLSFTKPFTNRQRHTHLNESFCVCLSLSLNCGRRTNCAVNTPWNEQIYSSQPELISPFAILFSHCTSHCRSLPRFIGLINIFNRIWDHHNMNDI